MPALYFLGTRLLASAPVPATPSGAAPHSEAYFCATCGSIWARVVIPDSPFTCHTVPCHLHQRTGVADWSTIPGSFLRGPDPRTSAVSSMFWASCLDRLPPEVLSYELSLLIES